MKKFLKWLSIIALVVIIAFAALVYMGVQVGGGVCEQPYTVDIKVKLKLPLLRMKICNIPAQGQYGFSLVKITENGIEEGWKKKFTVQNLPEGDQSFQVKFDGAIGFPTPESGIYQVYLSNGKDETIAKSKSFYLENNDKN